METPRSTTLLELVWAVSETAVSEAELVATVAMLINSGTVRLCGTFAGARIDISAPGSKASASIPTLTFRRSRHDV